MKWSSLEPGTDLHEPLAHSGTAAAAAIASRTGLIALLVSIRGVRIHNVRSVVQPPFHRRCTHAETKTAVWLFICSKIRQRFYRLLNPPTRFGQGKGLDTCYSAAHMSQTSSAL